MVTRWPCLYDCESFELHVELESWRPLGNILKVWALWRSRLSGAVYIQPCRRAFFPSEDIALEKNMRWRKNYTLMLLDSFVTWRNFPWKAAFSRKMNCIPLKNVPFFCKIIKFLRESLHSFAKQLRFSEKLCLSAKHLHYLAKWLSSLAKKIANVFF